MICELRTYTIQPGKFKEFVAPRARRPFRQKRARIPILALPGPIPSSALYQERRGEGPAGGGGRGEKAPRAHRLGRRRPMRDGQGGLM